MNKKGLYEVSSLGALAIVLVVAAITISIGSQVISGVNEQIDDVARTKTNDTFTIVNNTPIALSDRGVCDFSNLVIVTIRNDSTPNDGIMGIGNYSVNQAGSVNFSLTTNAAAGSYNVTYTYTEGDSGCNATLGGLDATQTMGSWLDTIALIVVAAVVIGIIASSFGRT